MQSSQIVKPTPIGSPFAVSGNKNIPSQTASGTDTSSISEGFLPITQEPLDDGGQAPERVDFNGMFYVSTDQRFYLQNGSLITYDPDVATKIGGYPAGAILAYSTSSGLGYVKSLIDNNQYNFITTPSYINGVYWQYVPIINTLELIKTIYPVGSIYISTTSNCPLASLFGTWSKIAADMCLQGSSVFHAAGTTIPAGLPNITGNFGGIEGGSPHVSGAFYRYSTGHSGAGQGDGDAWIGFSASRVSSIYGNSTTVQPPAYVVNVWRRTA